MVEKRETINMAEQPKRETISEKEFRAEEAERKIRFDAILARIKCVSPL